MDGVEIEVPLEGTLILIKNEDQPGVIGEVGTILGKAGAPSAMGDAHIRTNSHGYAYGMRF